MLPMLALGALSLGGSLLQGMGAQQASAKQARLQAIADATARNENQKVLDSVNAEKRAYGEMLARMSDPAVVVDEAQRAGFNPVTWLSAGYGTRMSALSDAYRLMSPEYQLASASQVPQQHSMLSALGAGLSSAGTAMGTQYRADQAYNLNMSKIDASMDQFMMGLSNSNGLKTALSYGMGSAGVTRALGGTGAGAGAVGGLAGGKSSKNDDAFWPGYEHAPTPIWEAKKPESTNPLPPDWGWKIPPGFANAEAYEDSLGEAVSIPYGLWKGANTILYNTYGMTIPEVFRDAKQSVADIKANVSANFNRPVVPYSPFAGSYPSWATP